ncbi:response regulator transcription factor [Pandoraea nosoerga]|uniref:DNA-binding response regulator n=1 Tax=Pandoraea nosoerga TaxID=2508296 RepID=A0A5E4TQW2_9BURK|nr:LuxR C-terminal-related transcriptional regulator [Pandoraea nosoerga]MBN4664941.1 response regulator transcription factor [Pandoraea nosoerga]MBN4675343.1 response regulator transcription factor [Pandoraea nosoerga]MBN4680684.1 response regulator transcription factor [Pandoraea nosoerga]MBN4745870.1 response regulator transcription factor [Pandoraea nosoerga]VVD90255.1 DNA-binding response regulator [Pandoraea nosoerga]
MKLEGGRSRAVSRAASDAGWREAGTRREPPRASHRAPRKARETEAREDEPRHHTLSVRENEVFHMLVDGLAVNEVAHALHLSERTIASHVASILHKLALGDSAELIGYAVRHGLVDEGAEGVA